MPQLKNSRWELYAQGIAKGLSSDASYAEAGYKPNRGNAARLKANESIMARIDELKAAAAELAEIDAAQVLKRWQELAFADPNELTSVVVGSCRFCHGENHKYQWRDEAEFDETQRAHFDLPDEQRVKKAAPVIGGGFGYTWRRPPHPDCPRCDGFGLPRTVLRDTTTLSAGGRALYAGVKETQHGVEIKTHDQAAALASIAKHLGMFPNKVELSGKDGKPIETINTNMTPQEAAEAYASTLGSDKG